MPAPVSPGASFLTKLFDLTLGVAATSIDTGATLDAGFSALELVAYARTDRAAISDEVLVQFNGDTGANYDLGWIRNNTGTANASSAIGGNSLDIIYAPAATSPANSFGAGWMVIPHYDNTVGFKSCVATHGHANSSTVQVWTQTGQWRSTAAINRVKMLPSSGTNLVAGSRLIIYGRS